MQIPDFRFAASLSNQRDQPRDGNFDFRLRGIRMTRSPRMIGFSVGTPLDRTAIYQSSHTHTYISGTVPTGARSIYSHCLLYTPLPLDIDNHLPAQQTHPWIFPNAQGPYRISLLNRFEIAIGSEHVDADILLLLLLPIWSQRQPDETLRFVSIIGRFILSPKRRLSELCPPWIDALRPSSLLVLSNWSWRIAQYFRVCKKTVFRAWQIQRRPHMIIASRSLVALVWTQRETASDFGRWRRWKDSRSEILPLLPE